MNTVDSHMLPFIHPFFRQLYSDASAVLMKKSQIRLGMKPLRVLAHGATTNIYFPCFCPLITVLI